MFYINDKKQIVYKEMVFQHWEYEPRDDDGESSGYWVTLCKSCVKKLFNMTNPSKIHAKHGVLTVFAKNVFCSVKGCPHNAQTSKERTYHLLFPKNPLKSIDYLKNLKKEKI